MAVRTHSKTFLHKTSHKFQDGVLTFQKGDDAERRWKQVTLSHAGAEPRGLGSAEENRGDKSNITTMPQSYFSSHHSFSFRTCNNHQVYQSTTAATTKQQGVLTSAEIMSITTMSCANNPHTANLSYA